MRVAEPQAYLPATHADLFGQVITQLVSPSPPELTNTGYQSLTAPEPFDLLVFPEAFAPLDVVLQVLRALAAANTSGSIHVGLRSSRDLTSHLIGAEELRSFVESLISIPNLAAEDLGDFSAWLQRQRLTGYFNVGCLFARDVRGRLRICLHPKLIRSQWETSPLPEGTMVEGDLLTLVTLQPSDRSFFPVTIQPLICSDILNLQTDRGTQSPLHELQREANIFEALPDHVDIVSITTCTPQKRSASAGGRAYREWHQDFRAAFDRAAQDGGLPRHHFASFVLSNFHTLPEQQPGGLSGIFEPVAPGHNIPHRHIDLTCFGYPKANPGNNRWSTPDDEPIQTWRLRGYIASLDSEVDDPDAAVTIFGFTLPTLLRDNSPWKPRSGVRDCEVVIAKWVDPHTISLTRSGTSL